MKTQDSRDVLRLAAQLAREDRGFYRPLSAVADDALAIFDAGAKARAALESGSSAKRAFGRARKVARIYNADIVAAGQFEGIILGLRFYSGRYGKPGAVFPVA